MPCTPAILSEASGPRGPKYKEELIMLNENVVKLLKSGMWDLATCADGEPNVVPVAFKDVTSDGRLVVGDVFLDTTLKNLAANRGRIAVSVYDAKALEGYQIKGALVIAPDRVIVTTPDADNKKEL